VVRRVRWEWWGITAGLLGLVANVLTDDQSSLSDAERRAGAAVVEQLDRAQFHIGVVAGLLAVFCLVMLATAWSRWAAALCAWMGLVQRTLPRCLGAVSALAALIPVAVMIASCAVAIAGLVGPVWLALAGVGLTLRRSAPCDHNPAR